MPRTATDKYGKIVKKGSRIKVLNIADWLYETLPENELEVLDGMLGQIFTVNKIDKYGVAWIEKIVVDTDDDYASQSLSLEAEEMELVE